VREGVIEEYSKIQATFSVNHKNKLQATITYFIQLLSLHILSDEAKLVDLGNLKLFYEFFDAIDLATKLKLKTLDLLHLWINFYITCHYNLRKVSSG
jgi:hypothetical protein